MGKNQSKEVKDQIVIAQSGANVSGMEAQLNQFSIAITVVIFIMILIIMYFLYKKCHKRTKRWVQRQVMAIAPVQNVQTAAAVSTPTKLKIVTV